MQCGSNGHYHRFFKGDTMKLYIVGFGPGNYVSMTMEACSAIERCSLIVGYTTYTDILKKYFLEYYV